MTLFYSSMETAIGRIYLAQHPQGLSALTLGDTAEEILFTYLQRHYPKAELSESRERLKEVTDQLGAYFFGTLTDFSVDFHLSGTAFQQQVWKELLKIPYGETISYGDLANRLGNPGGMRAVGAANGQNPIPIIIPCHRVIAADGSLGGYTGGLKIKRQLLDLESQRTTPTLF